MTKRIFAVATVLAVLASLLGFSVGLPPVPATAQQSQDGQTTVFLPLVFSDRREVEIQDMTIRLKSRSFIPKPGLDASLASQLGPRQAGRIHMLIQFDRVPSRAERQFLTRKGVTLLNYIPNLAWFASIPASRVTALDVLAHTPARWLGLILPEDRIDPFLLSKGAGEWAQNQDGTVKVKVTFFEDVARVQASRVIAQLGGRIESEFVASPSYWISIAPAGIGDLMEQDEVQFIGFYPPPSTTLNDGSTQWTRADEVQNLGIVGTGVVVSLWDGDEVFAHGDLVGRVTLGDATGTTSEHSTHVACTMAGDGSVSQADPALADLSGYALGAPTIVSYNFDGNVPNEYTQALTDHGIEVANNSWGAVVGWWWDRIAAAWRFSDNQDLFGAYTLGAPEYDGFVRDDGLTIVWAVGNDRNDPANCCIIPGVGPGSDPAEPPDWDQGMGNSGYDTLGPRSTAKNVIAVGAIVDGTDGMSTFSNWGPTDDGRIKPDVVAPGVDIDSCSDDPANPYVQIDGTSMASPAVSGAAALITEQYSQTFGVNPLPSTIKALLVNEAVDLTENPHTVANDNLVGPDFIYGWGRIDTLASINRVRAEQVTEGSLDADDPADTYLLRVLPGTPSLRVTIAWDDEPGAENADPALVNDLDLVLVDPDGVSHYPWVLDPANPNTPATTGVDRLLNNVEQVQIDAPLPGIWEVQVSPFLVPEGPQAYSLVPFQEPVNLSITKADDPDPVVAGEPLTYTIAVTNSGPAAATAVTVTDQLPPEVAYVSGGAGCTEAPTGTLTCPLGPLGVSESLQFEMVVTVDPATVYNAGGPTTITNTVEVISPEPDEDVSDDVAYEETEVVAAADLEIVSFEAVDAPDEVLQGAPATVTLRKVITNHGPSAPMDVELTQTALAPPDSTVVPTLAVTTQPALGHEELRTVTETFTITCGGFSNHTFTFTNEIQPLHPEDTDPDPSNNTATAEVTVECVLPAIINIKPGSDPNSINPRSRDVVPIAVLTTQAGEYGTPLDFDATTIDPLSVRFGPRELVWTETGGAFEAHGRGHIEDSKELDEVTMDGDMDMVLHFHVRETGITFGDTEACAKGTWFDVDGHAHTFFGCDAVRTVGD